MFLPDKILNSTIFECYLNLENFVYESELQAQLIPTDYLKPKPYLINLCISNINL